MVKEFSRYSYRAVVINRLELSLKQEGGIRGLKSVEGKRASSKIIIKSNHGKALCCTLYRGNSEDKDLYPFTTSKSQFQKKKIADFSSPEGVSCQGHTELAYIKNSQNVTD